MIRRQKAIPQWQAAKASVLRGNHYDSTPGEWRLSRGNTKTGNSGIHVRRRKLNAFGASVVASRLADRSSDDSDEDDAAGIDGNRNKGDHDG